MRAELELIERIVIALGGEAPAAHAIEIAAALAKGLDRPLAALLVENEQLLRLAELPMAREMGFPSALLRPIERGDIERDLRVRAERMRRHLGEVAQRLALQTTLEVVRGDLLREALGRLTPAELLVIWRGARFGETMAATRMPVGARLRARQVAVLASPGDAGVRALFAAHALAHELNGEVLVLVAAAGVDALRRLRAEYGRLLGTARAHRVRYLRVADLAPRALGALLRAERVGMLIVARGTPAEALLLDYCAEGACPVGLVA